MPWPVLLDVYRVAPCMPGASIESGEGNDYVGRIKVRLGPVEMVYRGDLHFTQRVDASHALAVEGAAKDTKGGGGAKAKVSLKVAEHGLSACMVSIHSDYAVSGKAAQFGRGVMEEVAEKLMNEFSTRLRQLILEVPARTEMRLPLNLPKGRSVECQSGAVTHHQQRRSRYWFCCGLGGHAQTSGRRGICIGLDGNLVVISHLVCAPRNAMPCNSSK
ncbi:MAG: SRPBCC family protein [Sphingomonadales bacterium]|nr:SRPBCC family protein [Sphingomonadales bacterium]